MINILLYSHHLPAWYCINIVRRNYVLVTCGSERVKSMIAAMELETKIRSRRKGRFGLGGHYTTQTKALLFSSRTKPPPFPFCYPCERNKFMSTKQKTLNSTRCKSESQYIQRIPRVPLLVAMASEKTIWLLTLL